MEESNNFRFSGTVISLLEPRHGVSQKGEWVSRQFVVRNNKLQYNKDVLFDVFGQDKIDKFDIKVGDNVVVSFNLSASSYNGRYFLSAKVWDCKKISAASQISNLDDELGIPPVKTAQPKKQEADFDDDLPF